MWREYKKGLNGRLTIAPLPSDRKTSNTGLFIFNQLYNSILTHSQNKKEKLEHCRTTKDKKDTSLSENYFVLSKSLKVTNYARDT